MTERGSYVVGLIGAGIEASLSPALHEREAAALGLRYVYTRIDLDELGEPPEAVGRLLSEARRMGYAGVNVTHPSKQLVAEHLDALSPQARALGAVNTVVFEGDRAVGHNTDWLGFAESFRRGLPDAATERVVLLGAGGAGTAVAHATLELGAQRLTVVDAEPERAAELAGALDDRYGAGRAVSAPAAKLPQRLEEADGLIHATPTGMAAHPGSPVDADLLRDDLWVADVVYRPLRTPLLRAAGAAGCRTLDGGGMAVFQAAGALELFTGLQPDRERMLAHFARLAQPADEEEDPCARQ